MTWENTVRERKKARRRRDLHEGRINTAPTQRQRLSAACQWLISESALAGRIDDAVEHVLHLIHDLRGETRR